LPGVTKRLLTWYLALLVFIIFALYSSVLRVRWAFAWLRMLRHANVARQNRTGEA